MDLRNHRIANWCLKHASVLIFVLALSVRLVIIFTTKTYLYIEHTEAVRIATSLATRGTFADAYGHTGPTAHAAPLYPLILSVVFRIFGTGLAGELAQEVLSSTIASLIYASLPTLSMACGLGSETGILAGVLGAALPVNFWSETKGSFEAPLVGLFLVMFCIAMGRDWRSQGDFSTRSACKVGMLSGIGLLASPTLAPVILASLFLGYILFRKTKAKEYIRFTAIVVGIAVLCLTPWTVRNYLVLGSPVWARSNLGLELYIANNDLSEPNLKDNYRWFDQLHPFASPAENAKLRVMGEIPYEREKLANAERWIAIHPKRFTWLTVRRIYYFWFPTMTRRAQTILMALFTVGAAAGLIQLLRSRNVTASLFLGIVTFYPLIYYFVSSFPRYRSPIDWVLIFLCSFWICSSRYFAGLRTRFHHEAESPALPTL
ncbi:MAG: hypothetical protein ACLQBK_12235 [Candidatus Sulfotelmatobacter sp.]